MQKAMVKMKVADVVNQLRKATTHHRLKMTYGSEISGGGFFSPPVRKPIALDDDYWPLMMKCSPWNEIGGIYMAVSKGFLKPDADIWISVELAGKLGWVD